MEELLACRACLATDSKLYNMYKFNLVNPYEMVTGMQASLQSVFSSNYQLIVAYNAIFSKTDSPFGFCENTKEVLSLMFKH